MMSRFMAVLILFVIGTDLFVVSPLLPTISLDLGMPTPLSGLAVSVFALAYLLAGPWLGARADRLGRHRLLATALIVFAAANAATALAPDAAVLLTARGVAGLAASGVTPTVYALVGRTAPASRRAAWLATATSGLLMALATGAPLGALWGAVLGWRGAFALLAVVSAALPLLLSPSRRRSGPEDRPAADRAVPPPPLWAHIRAVTATALWATAVYGLYTYLGTILRLTLRLSPGLLPLALVCFGLGATAGNLLGGHGAGRRGGRAVSGASLGALAATGAAVGLAVHGAPALLLAALGLMALVAYPFFPAQQARLVEAFPAHSGVLLAWNNSAMYAGILVGSALGGTLLDAAGPSGLAFAAAGVAVLAAVAAAGQPPRSSAPVS